MRIVLFFVVNRIPTSSTGAFDAAANHLEKHNGNLLNVRLAAVLIEMSDINADAH